ncbi:hypothetical protein HY26_02575 [Hyphomonas sp. GM-8P]|nr:hypothetical protein HY26_02575 [Hyphomonas sp. GM-8P]
MKATACSAASISAGRNTASVGIMRRKWRGSGSPLIQ